MILPTTEIGADPDDIRRYVAAAEEAGYDHLLAYDHVVGADIANRPNWPGPYTYESQFHEPLTLFGFLAAISDLELVTGILILPQRQTVLVAKQAAQIDILSRGKLRLGVGIGWNPVEYESLGMDFATKARRIEEQMYLLRRLWTDPLVNVVTDDHRVVDAGINPLPVQRPIPLWLSGAPLGRIIERVGRLADGWMPLGVPTAAMGEAYERIKQVAAANGRDPDAIGMQGQLPLVGSAAGRTEELYGRWSAIGVTHIAVNTMNAGLGGVDAHITVIREAASLLGIAHGKGEADGNVDR
ncbi:MAG TPA: LLM class F420-dependent oxidoreductase [Ilumatobacteraceae bacterium]|nr:LLM class F420-dependent oxidoreductase [Ilumatobacteraceae bacterium]